jgi:tetratricopeptide (TPR) repeat protein
VKKFLLISCLLLAACGNNPAAQRDKYFKNGQKYLDAGKYEEASIEFRNALRADNGHIPSFLALAETFQKQGNHQNAIQAYQQVVKLDGKNVSAKLRLGNYMLSAAARKPDLFKQAQQLAEEALKVEPSNVNVLILLGNAYSGQNSSDPAIQQFVKALSLDPGNLSAMIGLAAAYFGKKDMERAEATFKEALQRHPKEVSAHLATASFYAAGQRPQETENQLKQAFDLAPSDPRCLYSLANFYLSAKRKTEAEGVFKLAIEKRPNDREPRWGLSGFYLQQGDFDKSIQELNGILKVSKGDRAARLRLAEIYIDRGKEDKAVECIKTLLDANKNDAQAHFLQGLIFRRHQEFDKALTEFETALKLDASILPAYLEKASLQLIRGDLDACGSTLKAALQKNSGYLPARGAYAKLLLARQQPQEALQEAQKVLDAMPGNEDALTARAETLRSSNRLEESKKDWIQLCEMHPKKSQYWHRLGVVEAMQSNNEAALTHFRKAVELTPSFTTAINDMLFLHMKQKRFETALSELDSLAKKGTPADEIHRFRGQVFLAKGDPSAAESEFRKTIEINPQSYQTYILLGQLSMRRNDLPNAIREVDQLIARNGKMPAAQLLKGYYLQLAKDIPGAIASYRKALELDPENVVAGNNLAWLLCEGNANLEEALSLAKNAKKKAPEDPEIAETLGWIYYKMKNYTLAVYQLQQSVGNRKQPQAEHYYRLGMAFSGKGDAPKAKQTLRKALELNPKFKGAEEARKILAQP